MVDDILAAGRRSMECLRAIRQLPDAQLRADVLEPMLQQAIEAKWRLPPSGEKNIYRLAVQSISRQDAAVRQLPPEAMRRAVEKYDCHQTTLVAKKKTLLFLYMESALGVHLEDAEAAAVETVPQLAGRLAARLAEVRAAEREAPK